MKTNPDFLSSYYQLREQIDKRTVEISEIHNKHLNCKKGCDSCCEAISVFPLEFAAIKKELQLEGRKLPYRRFNKFRKSCMFLINGACSIYNSRPIICRTQGLPLMYQNINGQDYEVSYCQLNFKDNDLKNFSIDNSMFMPDFNSKLFMLNKSFVESRNMYNKSPKKRIPIYKLTKNLGLK